jgi:catechol 2,3-dioxygenase-like lactoylglutathione lyase family enzyme
MSHRGFSHIGLSTLDLDKTRASYEGVLGFKPVVADTINVKEGGHFDTSFSMSAAISSSPFWNRTALRVCRQITMRVSTAD